MKITFSELSECIDNLSRISQAYGFTAQEWSEAAAESLKYLPPPGLNEIELIRKNPNLNFIQKFFLIRSIKKG